ncbi:hypothetical protein Tco_1110961 [Tanacetum coccineum]|uniref:Uncharacterized protein n=1 Tax=Tanacetum coccineum TaxID=301880 RepID=A0ABQ5IKA4_9ASTR
MLVEKKYPLKKEILEKMINLKIEAEEESSMAHELIKFIKSQIAEQMDNGKSVSVPFGAHMKVSLKDCLSSDWDVERMSKVKYVNVVGLVYSTGKHVDVDGFVDANYAKELDNGGSITGVMVLTEAVNESIWLKSLRIKLGVNQYINVRYHSIIEIVDSKEIEVAKTRTEDNTFDAFTKGVLAPKFKYYMKILGVD